MSLAEVGAGLHSWMLLHLYRNHQNISPTQPMWGAQSGYGSLELRPSTKTFRRVSLLMK